MKTGTLAKVVAGRAAHLKLIDKFRASEAHDPADRRGAINSLVARIVSVQFRRYTNGVTVAPHTGLSVVNPLLKKYRISLGWAEPRDCPRWHRRTATYLPGG